MRNEHVIAGARRSGVCHETQIRGPAWSWLGLNASLPIFRGAMVPVGHRTQQTSGTRAPNTVRPFHGVAL